MKTFFVDTNILIYAFSADEPEKSEIANKLLFEGNGIISLQVINEFANTCLRKFKQSPKTVIDSINELTPLLAIVDFTMVTQINALKLCQYLNFSYYDALIVATALENQCSALYSEDMQHGQVIEGRLVITNPFLFF